MDPAVNGPPVEAERGFALPGVSVVIPNYNGEELLRENLPSVIRALERWGGEHEVIVVDDGSSDGSCKFLESSFPSVTLRKHASNIGFSGSCNAGMAVVRHPVAFCINNDVKVGDDLVEPVVRHFRDETVFAVTPAILAEREGKNQGVVVGKFAKGFLRGGFAAIGSRVEERENLYAVGACVAYDMEKFRALGGYAEIYSPFLFEDVDISYRAWKRGWRSIYEPGATVQHLSGATIGRSGKRTRRKIYFRNRFLFHWINLTDPLFMFRNLLHTAIRLAVSFLWLDFAYYASFAGALRRFGGVRLLRRDEAKYRALRDRDVFRRTGGEGGISAIGEGR